jgi:hypothetical protein
MSPLDRLRALCLNLPEASERISHGEPMWFAGKGKGFAMFDDRHHGSPHVAVWLLQAPGVQERLIARDPERYFRPPYVGHRGWVAVILDGDPPWGEIADLVRDAWFEAATKRLRTQLMR